MKITNIKIDNFRSIKQTDFTTTEFNIFVGQNNCGKTNFFEAVEFFFNGISKSSKLEDLRFKRETEIEIIVEITFIGAIDGAAQMQNEANRTKIQNALGGSDVVTFKRSSLLPTKRKMFINGTEVNPGTGFDAAWI